MAKAEALGPAPGAHLQFNPAAFVVDFTLNITPKPKFFAKRLLLENPRACMVDVASVLVREAAHPCGEA